MKNWGWKGGGGNKFKKWKLTFFLGKKLDCRTNKLNIKNT